MFSNHSLIDTFVVVGGTILAIRLLRRNPVELIGYLPAALSLSFFIQSITLLTLWQTIPLLLLARMVLISGIRVGRSASFVFYPMFFLLIFSGVYAFFFGDDTVRVIIRLVYYLGIVALFCFCYEMGKHPDCYEILLKGLVITGVVYAVYGLYQIIAVNFGLPVRLIVRGGGENSLAFEQGFYRINSLANEPKRLGYLLFICGIACFFLAQLYQTKSFVTKAVNKKIRIFDESFYVKHPHILKRMGVGILGTSLFTFAGSYYLTLALFAIAFGVLYPKRTVKIYTPVLSILILLLVFVPDLGVFKAVEHGYERRTQEVVLGLDGAVVYRQEFFVQDYLTTYPGRYISGLGLGQYYSVFFKEYGEGAGYNTYGGLMPLNSNFYEMLLDFGGVGAVFFYCSMFVLILKLRHRREKFLCLGLLFLILQSFSILTLQFMVFFAGIATARLSLRSDGYSKYRVIGNKPRLSPTLKKSHQRQAPDERNYDKGQYGSWK